MVTLTSPGARTFRTVILHRQPVRTIYDTLLLTNSTLLAANTNLSRGHLVIVKYNIKMK